MLKYCHDDLEEMACCPRCNAIAQGCETEEEIAEFVAECERWMEVAE